MGELLALTGGLCWGVSSVFARKAQIGGRNTPDAGMYLTVTVNNIINIVVITVMLLVSGPVALNGQAVILFALGGLFNTCVGRGMFMHCVSLIGAARGGAIKGLMPLFVVIGGVLVLGERLAPADWCGIAILLFGVFLIGVDSLKKGTDLYKQKDREMDETELAAARRKLKKGIFVGIMSAFFFAAGNICRKAGTDIVPNSVVGVTVGALTSQLVYGAYMFSRGRWGEIAKILRKPELGYVYYGIGSGLGLYCLFLSLATITVAVANSLLACEPVFTMIFSALLLGARDAMSKITVGGCFLIAAGAVVLILL